MDPSDETAIDATLLRLRVVVGALITGVLVFSAIVVFLLHGRKLDTTDGFDGIFFLILPAFALTCVVGYSIFRKAQDRQLDRAGRGAPLERLLRVYTTRTIVGAAMAESVALLSGIAYLLTGSDWMILGIVAALVVMTGFLPKAERIRDFVAAGSRPA